MSYPKTFDYLATDLRDSTNSRTGKPVGGDGNEGEHAKRHNDAAKEINIIKDVLGLEPEGSRDSVGQRILAVEDLAKEATGVDPSGLALLGTDGTVGGDGGSPLSSSVASKSEIASLAGAFQQVDEVACFGDSFTASNQDGEMPWPKAMEEALGLAVFNGGIGGMCSSDIAIRQGGLVPVLTFPENQIPAGTGATTVTVTPTTVWQASQGAAYSGSVSGIHGVLTRSTAGAWTFARSTAGTAVTLEGAADFVIDSSPALWGRVQTLESGRNNLASTDSATLAINTRDLDLMVRALQEVGNRRYLVLAVPCAVTETIGTTNYNIIAAANAVLASRHGDRWADWQTWMITNGLVLAGITPTVQDRADLNGGVIPHSLRDALGDRIHLSTTGYTLLRHYLEQKMATLGFLSGLIPMVAAGNASAPTLGTATGSTQPLSWSAVTGASAYRVEYRLTGTTDWIVGAYTAGTSATIEGLEAAASYDYRLTAWNIVGASAPSATATGLTSGSPATIYATDSFSGEPTPSMNGRTVNDANGGTLTGMAWSATNVALAEAQISNHTPASIVNALVDTTAKGPVTSGGVSFKVVALPNSGNIDVVARFGTQENCYRCSINVNGTVNIAKGTSNAAKTTVLVPALQHAVAPGDTVKLLANGTTIAVYVNGILQMSTTDSSVTEGNKWGVFLPADTANTARLANFALTSL